MAIVSFLTASPFPLRQFAGLLALPEAPPLLHYPDPGFKNFFDAAPGKLMMNKAGLIIPTLFLAFLFFPVMTLAQNEPKAGPASVDLTPGTSERPNEPLTYEAVLAEAEHQGLIKKFPMDEAQVYFKALAKGAGLPDQIIAEGLNLSDEAPDDDYEKSKMLRSYVVLSPDFIMPANLHPSRYLVTYILPEGLPKPESIPEGAEVYSLDEGLLSNRNKEYSDLCGLPNLKLPPKLKVYAGSGFLGSPVDFAFGLKRLRAELVPITVNSPDEPVALILRSQAFGPTIWHFSWTEGTKIAAVVVSGHGEQRVIGLPKGVPVLLNSNANNHNNCPELFFPASIKSLRDIARLSFINDLSRHLFNKDIDHLYFAESCLSLIGAPLNGEVKLTSAEELKLKQLIDPEKPWGNETTLTEDIFKGLIRKATVEDMRQRSAAIAREAGLPEHIIRRLTLYDRKRVGSHAALYTEPNPIPNTYVVLSSDFGIPATLYQGEFVPVSGTTHGDRDSASAAFIYPDGSLTRCSFYPSESRVAGRAGSDSSPAKAALPSCGRSGCQLPPNLKLIYRSSPLVSAYQVLSAEFISRADDQGGLSVAYPLPDGSRTYCSSGKLAGDTPEAKEKKQISSACGIPGFEAPPELKVYAAGVRSGSKLGFPMGRRGRTAERVKITVNSPEAPAALMLEASEPTIWQISWTSGTQIASVVVNSDIHEQRIIGLPEGVPVLYTDNTCPNFRVRLSGWGRGDLSVISEVAHVNALARHLFKRDIDQIDEIKHGQALIGEPLTDNIKIETAEEDKREDFTAPDKPLPGLHGLGEGVKRGFIRKADDDDYKKWRLRHYTKRRNIWEDRIEEAMEKDRELYGAPLLPEHAYLVISSDFILPVVLKDYGISSANFLVPEGMLPPSWPYDDNSTFYLMEDGTCRGKEAKPICEPKP